MVEAYLKPEDIRRSEEATSYLRDRLLIRLLFHLGCRISEALALKIEGIDLSQGLVTIARLKARIKLACPRCSARLSRNHSFCSGCGTRVEKIIAKQQEHQKMRTLHTASNILSA